MSTPARHFYEFDSFRLDETEQVLKRDGHPVPLSPKLFDTLLALVRNSGHVVEKQELIKQVWPDTFVEENNLSQYISTLRRTLGDGRHEQRYIETVPRRGYRFAVAVREVWDGDVELVRATHTKVSLAVKEEIEEEEDCEPPRRPETRRDASSAPANATPRRRSSAPLVFTVLVVVTAGSGFGLYKLNEQRQRATNPVATRAPATAPLVQPSVPRARDFTIKTFDPGEWPRTDGEIGVEGFVIEDFEDPALVEGLKIELSDSSSDNFGPTVKLPMVFNPDINDSGGARVFVPGLWDGSRLLINRRSPPPHGYADYVWGDVTFHLPGGATSFGFSLDDMDLNTELFVNDISQTNIRRLLPSGTIRNGYVRIDAAPGEVIYKVKVANSANQTTGDGLAFDHVAFKPLPR